MNYWMTTHWPPRRGSDPNEIGEGIWLPDNREAAGKNIAPGDKVLIYQSLNGRTEIRTLADGSKEKIACQIGKAGIIAVGEVISNLYKNGDAIPSQYINGSEILWCWKADVKLLSKSGFIPRKDINAIMGYKQNYNYRGFGDYHSGLKKIAKDEYDILLNRFLEGSKIKSRKYAKKISRNSHGESLAHYLLKQYVVSQPDEVFAESGIELIKIEYPFPTGDRADILFSDKYGRIIGTEIEVHVNDEDYEGILQAIKYRFMAELMTDRNPGDSRAVLIAYSISSKLKRLCKAYNVEFIEQNEKMVDRWAMTGEGLRIKEKYKLNKNT